MNGLAAAKAVRVADVPAQPWRNGGGRTRELLAWPRGAGWRVRVSVATIDADGPFSAFEGVERWFAALEGAGVVLAIDGVEHRVTPACAPLRFDGAAAPGCRLIDRATTDLNLMLRAGTRGVMQRAVSGERWSQPWRWRAAFVAASARLECGDGATALELGAGTLFAPLPPGPCRLVALNAGAPMFWIGVDADVGAPDDDGAGRLAVSVHDDVPPEAARVVDDGLGAFNAAAAPLHEVRALSCFARDAAGVVIGGAVGRTWGRCCELQQLWVDPAWRGKGLGARIVRAFEARARERGCRTFYLETFSFQAPAFYRSLGYEAALALHGMAPGVTKYVMVREEGPHEAREDA